MRRAKGKAKYSGTESDDLDAPLLVRRDHPSSTPSATDSVFGRDRKNDRRGEEVQLQTFSSNAPRRRNTMDRPATPVENYVWHILESHHTLAGIALQYKVTTEQLMRFNNLGTPAELYTRERVKIPAKEYSTLLVDPEQYKSAEAGTAAGTLHTVALPRARSKSEVAMSGGRADGLLAGPADTDLDEQVDQLSPKPSAQDFLSKFDNQMESAISAMDATITKTLADDDRPVHIRPARAESWEFSIKDWRLGVIAICAVFLVSFSTYFLYCGIKAPCPAGSNCQDGGKHSSGSNNHSYCW